MKQITRLLTLLIFLGAIISLSVLACSVSCIYLTSYEVKWNKVIFQENNHDSEKCSFPVVLTKKVKNADIGSFKVLENQICIKDYAKDVNHVYYKGEVIDAVNAQTFQALPKNKTRYHGYYSDGKSIVYEGEIISRDIENFNPESRVYRGSGWHGIYAEDNNLLYANGNPIEKEGFVVIEKKEGYSLNTDYAKNNNAVFFRGEKTTLDPDTFELLECDFTKDKNGVYRNTKKLPFLFPEGFSTFGCSYFKDIHNVYFRNWDKNHYVYYKIEGADPATFTLGRPDYIGAYNQQPHDKNNVYCKGQIVKGLSTYQKLDWRCNGYGLEDTLVKIHEDSVPKKNNFGEKDFFSKFMNWLRTVFDW